MQLSVNGFKNFPHMGFSIACPGPGQLTSICGRINLCFQELTAVRHQ